MVTDQIETPDYLVNERINLLLNHGYFGFKVTTVKYHPNRRQFSAEASNKKGETLSAFGETKDDACMQLIDLIDITVDPY